MDEQPIAALNVIPFVDIMLVLLTMVLTTASFIATGRIPVSLPQATQTHVEQQKDETIELTAEGDIYFRGAIVSKDELEARVKGLSTDTSILIRADRAITFQKFIDVADVLNRLKYTKVAVQTRSSPK